LTYLPNTPYETSDPALDYYPLFPTNRAKGRRYPSSECDTNASCAKAGSDFPFRSPGCHVTPATCFVAAPGARSWTCKERSAKKDSPQAETPSTYVFSRTGDDEILSNQGPGPGKLFTRSPEVEEFVGFPEPNVPGGIVTYDVLRHDSTGLVLERVAVRAAAAVDAQFELLSTQHQVAVSVPGALALSYAYCDRFTDGP
jgi:hypothetical protein